MESLFLDTIWDYSYASIRTYVTNGNILYLSCYDCGINHQAVSGQVSFGNAHRDMIIDILFGTLPSVAY